MEYKNEFTRERLERIICDNIGMWQNLARSLLAELDQPKVWTNAPDNAIIAKVHFYKADKVYARANGIPEVYTRKPPKSRIDEIAEEAEDKYRRGAVGAGSLTDIIKSAIPKDRKEREANR